MARKSIFDKYVVMLFSGLAGASILVLGFKVATAPMACPIIEVTVSNARPLENAPINFTSDKPNAKTYDWDFGDSSHHSNTASANHFYRNSGVYKATLTINGTCKSDFVSITVRKDESVLPEPVISGPATAVVGQPVSFNETSGKGTSWEWSFGESGSIDASSADATYTFKTPGKKRVEVSINGKGKSKVATIEVDVKVAGDKPAGGGGGGGAKGITEVEFTAMLNDVIARKKTNAVFSACLCGKLKTPATINGKQQDFEAYSNQLNKSNYSTIIKNVTLFKDPTGNCITNIVINDKSGGWHPWRK